ncbi:MAG TPA: tetratricopeptide repeat protein [Anaerolineaceae bacterium]|nr:tetratricopeptide repeat protein [Anaerolineaceae bacterium]
MNLIRAMDQALTWLNPFDGPYVTDLDLKAQVREINNTQLFGAEFDALVQKALEAGHHFGDERLHGELGVLVAAAYFKKGDLEQARSYLEETIDLYRKARDSHREAVSTWMLGICLWQAEDCRQAAFEGWHASRDLFKMLAYHWLRTQPDPEKVKWYLDRIADMSVWMARNLEEAATWLNAFDPASLEPPTIVLRDHMTGAVQRGEYAQARLYLGEMMVLARDTGDYLQLPEVYVESAQVEFQMGNLEEADRRLDEASQRYAPGSHRQAVARWMLGCARWQIPGKEHLAIRGWQQAIVLFENLAVAADQRGDPTRRQWYQEHVRAMQGALEAEIQEM